MKNLPPILLALAIQASPLFAAEQVVTLGDSLTYAYESEFCFQKTITGLGTIGDGFNPAIVRNWIEILSDPVYRGDRFELGARDSVTVTPPSDPAFDLYFRQAYNWAIPGLKIHGLRQFMEGTATFTSLINSSSEFSTLSTILAYSNFNNATDFALTDLESQIQGTAERLVLSIGGNDIKAIYGTIYNGGSAGTFVADYMADTVAILDRIKVLNPNIQVVVVSVPHVGITLDVRNTYPTDAVKTERVSAVLRDLNGQLAALAASRGLGYADTYGATIPLLSAASLTIYGWNVNNQTGNASGQPGFVWMNGPVSKNFHPQTNAQAVMANEIIHAFNKRYRTGIPKLTASEIIIGLLGKTTANANMDFATWRTRYVIGSVPETDDGDGDGIPTGVEYALGLSPIRRDADWIESGISAGALEIAYPNRYPASANYTLVPESASSPAGPYNPLAVPALGTDGLYHARLTLGSGPGFLRLKSTIP